MSRKAKYTVEAKVRAAERFLQGEASAAGIEALRLPATRDAVKAKIKEQTRPSIIELLQNYKQEFQKPQAQKPRQHSWEER